MPWRMTRKSANSAVRLFCFQPARRRLGTLSGRRYRHALSFNVRAFTGGVADFLAHQQAASGSLDVAPRSMVVVNTPVDFVAGVLFGQI